MNASTVDTFFPTPLRTDDPSMFIIGLSFDMMPDYELLSESVREDFVIVERAIARSTILFMWYVGSVDSACGGVPIQQ